MKGKEFLKISYHKFKVVFIVSSNGNISTKPNEKMTFIFSRSNCIGSVYSCKCYRTLNQVNGLTVRVCLHCIYMHCKCVNSGFRTQTTTGPNIMCIHGNTVSELKLVETVLFLYSIATRPYGFVQCVYFKHNSQSRSFSFFLAPSRSQFARF